MPTVLPRNSRPPFFSFQRGILPAQWVERVRAQLGSLVFQSEVTLPDPSDREAIARMRTDPSHAYKHVAELDTHAEPFEWLLPAVRPAIDAALDELRLPPALSFMRFATVSAYRPGHHMAWHVDRTPKLHPEVSVLVQLAPPDEYDGGELLFIDENVGVHAAPKEAGTVIVAPSYVVHSVTPVTRGVRGSVLFMLH